MEFKNIDNVKYMYEDEHKFKTARVSFKYSLPIQTETCADLIVLNELMAMSCEKYPTVKLLNRKLSELYDAKVITNLSQKGKLIIFEVAFNYISNKYLPTNLDDEIIRLMNDILTKPNLTNQEYLDTIKQKRILEIEAIYDEKMQYAIKKMKETLDEKQEVLIDVNSTVEAIQLVSLESVNEIYQKLMSEANLTVTINSENSAELMQQISQGISFQVKTNNYDYLHTFEKRDSAVFIEETQNLTQSKLVVGSQLAIEPNDFIAFQVFNGIYGGFPFSRLFSNIREKQSLAYTVYSAFDAALNVMIIIAGIDNGDASQSGEAMLSNIMAALKHECDDIASGNVLAEEIDKSKKMLINSVKTSLDSQAATQLVHYSYGLRNETFSLTEFEKKVNAITIDDVVRMAKCVQFDVTYLLRGDK